MTNFVEHKNQVLKDFTASTFALYTAGEWGIEVGYIPVPIPIASYQMDMLDVQELDDCCALCASSQNPPVIIQSYAKLSNDPNCLFVPLFPHGFFSPCNVNQSLNVNLSSHGSCIS